MRQTNPQHNFIYAHRGGRGLFPENTWSAFRSSCQNQWSIELDVWPCKTGELVVIHDETLDRTSDYSGKVIEYSKEELKQIDPTKKSDQSYPPQAIPFLLEVVGEVGSFVKLDIEIKSVFHPSILPELILSPLLEQIQKMDLYTHDIFISSFHPEIIQIVHSLDPKIKLGYIYGSKEGVDVFKNPDRLSIEPSQIVLKPHYSLLNLNYILDAKKRGFQIIPWTVNDLSIGMELISMGVDGIITDRPDMLQNLLH